MQLLTAMHGLANPPGCMQQDKERALRTQHVMTTQVSLYVCKQQQYYSVITIVVPQQQYNMTTVQQLSSPCGSTIVGSNSATR